MARPYTKNDHPTIKKNLFELALSGAPRPRQKEGIEGRNLSSYTCETAPVYDADFNNRIRSLRPDWFHSDNRNRSWEEVIEEMRRRATNS